MQHEHECLFACFASSRQLGLDSHAELGLSADLGKATFSTAASIFQNRLLTPNFSPGFKGGKSFKCDA